MELVLAKLEELDEIKKIYTKIVINMKNNNINLWNEYYPNEVFEDDIKNNNMFLLKDGSIIVGAFVMHEHVNVENDLKWKDASAKAYLLNRVGINVDYLRQGNGQVLINKACDIAKKKGANYLRLLVSDKNIPAINLYLKCKFQKAVGIHEEKINDDFSIYEYGYEILLSNSDTFN